MGLSAAEVVLYTRPGCHLCDEARDLLESLRGLPPSFDVREVDIDSDDRLLAAYLERIPVVELDGEVIGELILETDALRAKLGTLGQ
jgi:glutaredoxin